MNQLFPGILFILIFASSCTSVYHFHEETTNAEEEEVLKFFDDVAKYIVDHDRKGFLQIVDPDYKKEQLDGLLNGNESQFLNEFFCGNDLDSEEFTCVQFDNVVSCTLNYLNEDSKDLYEVEFELKESEGKRVRATFYMHKINGYYFIYSSAG